MNLRAHVVLQDAKFAIEAHTDTLQSEYFRISWISVITLLRAVGHVLKKVDAETSPELKAAIEKKWSELQKTKPEPQIYWGFIECERNRFLKNYEHGIQRWFTFSGPTIDGKKTFISADGANSRGGQFSPGSKYESVISNGPFAGRSERSVAWDAYNWWENYLKDIERICEDGEV